MIQIWDNDRIEKYIARTDSANVVDPIYKKPRFFGFDFFGPTFLLNRQLDEENDLAYRHLFSDAVYRRDLKKDRAIVNIQDSEVTGIFSLIYGDFKWDYAHYRTVFLDIRKDQRRKGIATALIKSLNNAPFMFGEKLVLGGYDYTAMGRKYAKHVIERELTGENFEIYSEELGVRIK